MLLAAIGVGGFVVWKKLGTYKLKELDSSKVKVNKVKEQTKKAYKGYTTLALFGLDNREKGQLDKGLSDVVMLLSINNDSKKIQMISVYRDTYLNISNTSVPNFTKCNAAYAYGGAEQAVSMLNKNLDLDINNYVTFDFSAVAKAIDILGGVSINISDQEELKWLNKYIDHTNGILDTHAPQIPSIGKHKLNGVQSVAYARIRYTSGWDYKRAQRQRIVFTQMISKVKKANFQQLQKLLNQVFPTIQTGLKKTELLNMVYTMASYHLSQSRGFPFYKISDKANGYAVIPCDLEKNVKALHNELYGNKEYKMSEIVSQYNRLIIAKTGKTALSEEEDEFSTADGQNTNKKINQNKNKTTATLKKKVIVRARR